MARDHQGSQSHGLTPAHVAQASVCSRYLLSLLLGSHPREIYPTVPPPVQIKQQEPLTRSLLITSPTGEIDLSSCDRWIAPAPAMVEFIGGGNRKRKLEEGTLRVPGCAGDLLSRD